MSEIKQITQVEELYRYAKRCADSTMPDEAAAFALAAETIESQQAEIERLKAISVSDLIDQAEEAINCIPLHAENEKAVNFSGVTVKKLNEVSEHTKQAVSRLKEGLVCIVHIERNTDDEHALHFAKLGGQQIGRVIKMLEG